MIGKNLKHFMDLAGVKPHELSRRCRVSGAWVKKVLADQITNVGVETVVEAAKGLGLEHEPWRLLEGTPLEPPSHGESFIPPDYIKLKPEQKEMLDLFDRMSHAEQMLLKSMLIGIKGAQHIAQPKKKSRG